MHPIPLGTIQVGGVFSLELNGPLYRMVAVDEIDGNWLRCTLATLGEMEKNAPARWICQTNSNRTVWIV